MAVGPVLAQSPKDIAASLMRRQEGSAPTAIGRLWISADKMRLEVAELPDGYFLIDGAGPSATFVKPAARAYMDARRSSRLTQWFVPVDPADPCRQWQAMARLAGEPDHGDWRCERIGQEVVDGRDAIIYRAVSGSEQQFLGWVDPVLEFPLRIELGDGIVFAVEAIREQPQAAEFIQVPAGFHKFDPQALIERIKQSDVWIDTH
jgi:PAS domain-containing protein